MVATTHRPVDIGRFRKIKLWPVPNKHGFYEIRYCDAERGYVTVRHTTKRKDWGEAQTYLTTTFYAIAREDATAPVAKPKPSIEALCAAWIDWAELNGRHRSNIGVLRPVRQELGHRLPEELVAEPAILRDYRKARAGKSNWTVLREMGALRTVLKWSVDERLIDLSQLPSFKRVMPPEGAPRDRFLEATEERWFWDQALAWGRQAHATPQERDAAQRVTVFVALALETAARKGAILDLTWDRVKLDIGIIDYNIPGGRPTKKRRVDGMPISDDLMPVLREAWRQASKDASGKASGRVFGDVRHIDDAFNRFTRSIGFEWVTPHVLRHTWASLAAMAGVTMITIARVMGDSLATVEKYYAKLSPDHLRDGVGFKKRRPVLRVVAGDD